VYAAQSLEPTRVPLDELTAMRAPYDYFRIQTLYFYLDNLQDLYRIQKMDLLALLEQAHVQGDIEPGFVLC
jgi:phenylalanine-4-hydroxylase